MGVFWDSNQGRKPAASAFAIPLFSPPIIYRKKALNSVVHPSFVCLLFPSTHSPPSFCAYAWACAPPLSFSRVISAFLSALPPHPSPSARSTLPQLLHATSTLASTHATPPPSCCRIPCPCRCLVPRQSGFTARLLRELVDSATGHPSAQRRPPPRLRREGTRNRQEPLWSVCDSYSALGAHYLTTGKASGALVATCDRLRPLGEIYGNWG